MADARNRYDYILARQHKKDLSPVGTKNKWYGKIMQNIRGSWPEGQTSHTNKKLSHM